MAGNKKNILYVSNVCDDELFNYVLKNAFVKPSQAAQKFQKLLLEGFALNKTDITAMSVLPVDKGTIKQRFFNISNKFVKNIQYKYLPILNVLFIKDILIFITAFYNILKWSFMKKDKLIINNVLNLTVTVSSLIISKILQIKCIAIVTDLPVYMGSNSGADKFKMRLYKKLASYFMLKYDGYILLTEHMNDILNKNNKPYMVMEGMVDDKISSILNGRTIISESKKPSILYAGSLHRKYGILNLVNAFVKLNNPNAELIIYGSGDLELQLKEISSKHTNIKYYGVVENEIVTKELENATVLINPRPITGEYTKYSFPSKNIEYMASGTPLITTKLPGIPEEYYPYVFLLDGDTEDDILNLLVKIFNYSSDELGAIGLRAKKFVLEKKSNKTQTGRILDFANSI